MNALKELVEKSNPEDMSDAEVDQIRAAKETLMQSAQTIFSKMYEQIDISSLIVDRLFLEQHHLHLLILLRLHSNLFFLPFPSPFYSNNTDTAVK